MDINGLNGCNDEVTVEIDSDSKIELLNPHSMANILDRSFVSAMQNLAIQSISCDEERKKSDEDFSNDRELGEHVDSVKTKAYRKKVKRLQPPAIFRCEICLLEFENAIMLKEHLDGHDFQYSCKTCGENVKLTLDFIDHVWEHGTNKLYKCPLCEFEAEKRTKMTWHLQARHDQFKKYRCKICNKGMNVYPHFLQHKFTHTDEKPFKCDKCDSSFAHSVSLNSHYARMHIDDPISCVVCQKICRNKIDLRSHKSSHYRQPVICDICDKTLSSKDKLRIHKRRHTGEKPYSCRFCPKSFKTSSFRSDHERTHTGEKPHICPVCSRGFSQRTSMKVHETTHRLDKPFQCHICAKQFKSKIMYNGHMRKCSANSAVEPQVKEEVNSDDGIGQNGLHEIVNPERYGTLTRQALQGSSHVNVPQEVPWYQAYPYANNYYYNPLVLIPTTIAQGHYPNILTNSDPSNNYVQLGILGDLNGTSQAGNSTQNQQMNLQQGFLPISLLGHVNPSAGFYGSTSQLPMENTLQGLSSEMDDSQENRQENE